MIKRIIQFSNELERFYVGMHKSAIMKENAEIDDFFMIIAFSEIYGIENPYSLYTLELLPALMPKFHRWHQKVGLKHSFFENFPCSCCC